MKKIKKPLWEVIDTTSSAMSEFKTVIVTKMQLTDAESLSMTNDAYRVRMIPAKRR